MTKNHHMIVISITPFTDKGAVDEPALRAHLKRLRDAGPRVSVFVCGSGTGEGYTLTPEDQEQVMAIAVDELKGKTQIFGDGVEPRQPSDTIGFIRRAEKAKVDAVRIFSLDMGHGAKPSVPEMEKFYNETVEASSIPVILTSHFSVGYVLPADLIERLITRFPQITRLNVGTNDLVYLAEVVRRVGDRVEIHCAGPANGPTTLVLGGAGFMGPEGNFAPQLTAAVVEAFAQGDMAAMREAYSKLMAFSGILARFGTPNRVLKPLMGAFDMPGGGNSLRAPRVGIMGDQLAQAVDAVKALKIPGLVHG